MPGEPSCSSASAGQQVHPRNRSCVQPHHAAQMPSLCQSQTRCTDGSSGPSFRPLRVGGSALQKQQTQLSSKPARAPGVPWRCQVRSQAKTRCLGTGTMQIPYSTLHSTPYTIPYSSPHTTPYSTLRNTTPLCSLPLLLCGLQLSTQPGAEEPTSAGCWEYLFHGCVISSTHAAWPRDRDAAGGPTNWTSDRMLANWWRMSDRACRACAHGMRNVDV